MSYVITGYIFGMFLCNRIIKFIYIVILHYYLYLCSLSIYYCNCPYVKSLHMESTGVTGCIPVIFVNFYGNIQSLNITWQCVFQNITLTLPDLNQYKELSSKINKNVRRRKTKAILLVKYIINMKEFSLCWNDCTCDGLNHGGSLQLLQF
jgi:hypothetical protein